MQKKYLTDNSIFLKVLYHCFSVSTKKEGEDSQSRTLTPSGGGGVRLSPDLIKRGYS